VKKDLQALIPESHRDVVEAVPRGFPKAAVTAALLTGMTLGALVASVAPAWGAASIPAVLLVASLLYRWRSNTFHDRRMADIEARGMDWKPENDA
jgi:hypothetical protein